MSFPTKVDWWLAVLCWGTLAALGGVGAAMLVRGETSDGLGMLATVAGSVALLLAIAWPVRYEVGLDQLIVRAGWFLRWRIPLDGIEGVRRTRNPLSSPAWSIDRLQIRYRTEPGGRTRTILVSPVDQTRFIAALGLLADGSRLDQR